MTKEEIKQKILVKNPSRLYSLNGEIFEMTDEEFDKAISDRVEMEWQQEQERLSKEAERNLKISAYEKLGLSSQEIQALLG